MELTQLNLFSTTQRETTRKIKNKGTAEIYQHKGILYVKKKKGENLVVY